MNALESLASAVSLAVPAAWTRLRVPRDPGGAWWLDTRVDDHHVTVEWSPRRGFGVSASVLGDGYGEGPEETFTSETSAVERVVSLLQRRAFTTPPPPVALRELRALLGRTQIEVAERMGVGQAAVSRLEHRDDVTLSSLRRFVEALGGTLDIRVKTEAGEEMALLLGAVGSGKTMPAASLLCRHFEATLSAAAGTIKAEPLWSDDLAALFSKVRGDLPRSWRIPQVKLRTMSALEGATSQCARPEATISVCAERIAQLAEMLAPELRGVAGPPLASVWRQVTCHVIGHEIGHLVSADDVRGSFPEWVAADDELRADAVAGWAGSGAGVRAESGAGLARLLGCQVRDCTHPLPGDRAAAYLIGYLAGTASRPRAEGLSLLVIRARDIERARAFYDVLGLRFAVERHGNGPEHYAATLPGGTVFEIYPCSTGRQVGGGVRVGLRVADPEAAVRRLRSEGLLPDVARVGPTGSRKQVIDDLDGNTVELEALAAK